MLKLKDFETALHCEAVHENKTEGIAGRSNTP